MKNIVEKVAEYRKKNGGNIGAALKALGATRPTYYYYRAKTQKTKRPYTRKISDGRPGPILTTNASYSSKAKAFGDIIKILDKLQEHDQTAVVGALWAVWK